MREDMQRSWRDMENAHNAFVTALGEFLKGDKADRVDLITGGYKTNRYLTLEVLRRIPFEELKELLPFLMSHARSVHAYLGHVREIILRLPREWLLEHIEAVAEPLLESGSDDDYRRFLELYIKIDPMLTKRLALRAAASSDSDVREAGEDFIEILEQKR